MSHCLCCCDRLLQGFLGAPLDPPVLLLVCYQLAVAAVLLGPLWCCTPGAEVLDACHELCATHDAATVVVEELCQDSTHMHTCRTAWGLAT